MKQLILISLVLNFLSCEKCDKNEKNWHTDISGTKRITVYDWDKVVYLYGDSLQFGIGTEYFLTDCDGTSGQEELQLAFSKFYINQKIVLENDTIHQFENLLFNESTNHLIRINKKGEAFFNFPQYIIDINNSRNIINGDVVVFFEGTTISGHYFKDSCIARIL